MPRAAAFVPPMKALGSKSVPEGPWRSEIKFDGYRAVAVRNGSGVRLWSRHRKPLDPDYPEIVAAIRRLKCSRVVLDGELVALDRAGVSRFQLLQRRDLPGARSVLIYYAFDVMHLDGHDLRALPLEARQKLLQALLGKKRKGPLQRSPWSDAAPARVMEASRRAGQEGIVAKRLGSPYESDRRTGAWIKCKVHGEQEFVIGGFTPPKHSRPLFGALLVGVYSKTKLIYAGKVGTGFTRQTLESLHRELARRRRAGCPFSNLPLGGKPRFGTGMTSAAMREVSWVRPELVAQVGFAEWTQDNLLRQPVFLGLRKDKPAREVRREAGPPDPARPAGSRT